MAAVGDALEAHAAPRSRARWLFGPRADLATFLGTAVAALAILALGRGLGIRSTPPWVFVLCVVMVDVAHVHSTVFRVYLDRAEVRRRPWLYLGTPIAVYAAGVALHGVGGGALFWRVLAYLAVWHFVRQQVGFVALYRARAGEKHDPTRRIDAWLDPATTYVAAIYPLVDWHASLPRRFWWFVKGDFVPGMPVAAVTVTRAIWLALLIAFVGRQIQLTATRRAVNVGKVVVVLTTALLWWVGIVALDDDFAFTVTNVLPHGIPYVVLVAAYARRRYFDPEAPRAKVATALLRSGFVVAYGILVLVALLEEGLWDRLVWHDHEAIFGEGVVLSPEALTFVVPLLALPQVVHYLLDGAIWKGGTNPQLARYLGSDSVGPAPPRPS